MVLFAAHINVTAMWSAECMVITFAAFGVGAEEFSAFCDYWGTILQVGRASCFVLVLTALDDGHDSCLL